MIASTTLADLSAECWRLKQALADAKHAGDGDTVLREIARQYVDAAYQYQLAKYGKVRQRLSVAALLR